MKLLFKAEKTLTPADSKTHIALPFELPAGLAEIELRFSYTPKRCEDTALSKQLILEGLEKYAPDTTRDLPVAWEGYLPVQNLLTLSLDSPAGYAGCAHRHNPVQRHVVAPGRCSPGFSVANLEPGQWRAVVSAHCVATPSCAFILEVYAKPEDRP